MTDKPQRNPPPLIGQLFEMDGALYKVSHVGNGNFDIVHAVSAMSCNSLVLHVDHWRESESINFPSQRDFNVEHKNLGEHTTPKKPGDVVLYYDHGWEIGAIAHDIGAIGNPSADSSFGLRSAVVPSDRVGEVADWVRSVGGIVYRSANAPKPPLKIPEKSDFPAPGHEVNYDPFSTMDILLRKHIPAGVYVLNHGELDITKDCTCSVKDNGKIENCHPHLGRRGKIKLSSNALLSWMTMSELRSAEGARNLGLDEIYVCEFKGNTADGEYKTTAFWSKEILEVYLPNGLIEHFIFLRNNHWKDIEKKEEARQRDEMSHPLADALKANANDDAFPTESITTKTGQTLAKIVHGEIYGVSKEMDPKIPAYHVCPRCNASIDMPAHHGDAKCKCGWPHGEEETLASETSEEVVLRAIHGRFGKADDCLESAEKELADAYVHANTKSDSKDDPELLKQIQHALITVQNTRLYLSRRLEACVLMPKK